MKLQAVQENSKLNGYQFSFTYKLQHSFLLNAEKKDSDTKKCNDSVKKKFDFDKKSIADDKFVEQIVMDILGHVLYDHIKTEEPYIEPTVQDAQTIK